MCIFACGVTLAAQVRVDCTVTYGENQESVVMAHPHEDYDHDLWFSAYTPADSDGCYVEEADGTLNADGSWTDKTICWSAPYMHACASISEPADTLEPQRTSPRHQYASVAPLMHAHPRRCSVPLSPSRTLPVLILTASLALSPSSL